MELAKAGHMLSRVPLTDRLIGQRRDPADSRIDEAAGGGRPAQAGFPPAAASSTPSTGRERGGARRAPFGWGSPVSRSGREQPGPGFTQGLDVKDRGVFA